MGDQKTLDDRPAPDTGAWTSDDRTVERRQAEQGARPVPDLTHDAEGDRDGRGPQDGGIIRSTPGVGTSTPTRQEVE